MLRSELHDTMRKLPNPTYSAGVRPQEADRYRISYLWQLLLLGTLFFFFDVLDRTFKLGFWMVPLLGVPTLFLIARFACGLLVGLLLWRWKSLASIVAATVLFVLLGVLLKKAEIDDNWVLFQIAKPRYDQIIASRNDPFPRQYSWPWGVGSSYFFYRLRYDETGAALLEDGKSIDGGVRSVRSLGDHYYLQSVTN